MSSAFTFGVQPGSSGDSGGAGSGSVVATVPITAIYTVGPVAIPGNTIVRVSQDVLYIADPSDPWPDVYSIIGMTSQSGQPESSITVVLMGPCDGASGLPVGQPYFLGNNGIPTPTAPTFGWVVRIGTAQDSSTYNINITEPFYIPGTGG